MLHNAVQSSGSAARLPSQRRSEQSEAKATTPKAPGPTTQPEPVAGYAAAVVGFKSSDCNERRVARRVQWRRSGGSDRGPLRQVVNDDHHASDEESWHEPLNDPTIADAICDRLVHNAKAEAI